MDLLLLCIAVGVGLLCLVLAVVRVRTALRLNQPYIDKTVTDPVLLPWPRSGDTEDHAEPSSPH